MMQALLALWLLAPAAFAASESLVSVRGEGEVKVKPDKAFIHLQVLSKGKDARTAQSLNAKEMARVQKVLKSDFSIPEKDIQTTGFSLNPDYRYDNQGKQTFLGFQANHGLTVQVRKIDSVGVVLDRLIGKGSEEVSVSLNHVAFDSERRKEAEVEALGAAMKNARTRAEALAGFAKRSLKRVLRISDSSVQSGPVIQNQWAEMKMASAAAGGGTQVSAGEISISSQVAVDYELD